MHEKLRERLSSLPGLRETEGQDLDTRQCVYVFLPGSGATWVLVEYDPDTGDCFGLCDLGMGFPELGYVNLAELETVRHPAFGLPVEVDDSITVYGKGRAMVERMNA
jgi:hypothetical protein